MLETVHRLRQPVPKKLYQQHQGSKLLHRIQYQRRHEDPVSLAAAATNLQQRLTIYCRLKDVLMEVA
jgi:hypothetical protein